MAASGLCFKTGSRTYLRRYLEMWGDVWVVNNDWGHCIRLVEDNAEESLAQWRIVLHEMPIMPSLKNWAIPIIGSVNRMVSRYEGKNQALN